MNKGALEVANLAIAHTGAGAKISTLEEQSKEAQVCKEFIYVVRDVLLKEYDWNFARKLDAPLTLLELKPRRNWGYSYLYPPDCLKLRYLGEDDSPYKEALDDNRRNVFYSNEPALTATYTSDNLADSYPSDFSLGWSYALAISIAPTVSEGNIKTLIPFLTDGYKMTMDKAIENNANTDSPSSEQSGAMLAGGFLGIIP